MIQSYTMYIQSRRIPVLLSYLYTCNPRHTISINYIHLIQSTCRYATNIKKPTSSPITKKQPIPTPPKQLLVIDASGKNLGVLSAFDANALVDPLLYKLVIVNAAANPPVAKITLLASITPPSTNSNSNGGSSSISTIRKDAVKPKEQKQKELEINSNISLHDLNVKLVKLSEFLGKGYIVSVDIVSVFGKGEHTTITNSGNNILTHVKESVGEKGVLSGERKLKHTLKLSFNPKKSVNK